MNAIFKRNNYLLMFVCCLFSQGCTEYINRYKSYKTWIKKEPALIEVRLKDLPKNIWLKGNAHLQHNSEKAYSWLLKGSVHTQNNDKKINGYFLRIGIDNVLENSEKFIMEVPCEPKISKGLPRFGVGNDDDTLEIANIKSQTPKITSYTSQPYIKNSEKFTAETDDGAKIPRGFNALKKSKTWKLL